MITRNTFCVLLVTFLLLSCANVKPPSGGPPDKTPPKVVEFLPSNQTTNFQQKEIYIKFNKWMDRGSVVNNIFLNPPMKYEVKWNGKKMFIRFPENLPEETTFNLLIGTNCSDIDGNRPEQPFSLVFSTGAKIDSGRISGKIILGKEQNVYIYAIPTREISDSTLDINKTFHYRTQPDINGLFTFEALRTDSYIVFAYSDKNNNKEFDYGNESFGLSHDNIHTNTQHRDSIYLILTQPKDKIPPLVTNVIGKNPYSIIITFSEPVNIPDTISNKNFQILDTLSKKVYNPLCVLIDPNNKKEITLFFYEPLPDAIFSFNITNPNAIVDSSGNALTFEKPILMRISKNPEEVKPQILQNQIFLQSINDKVEIIFSKPLDTSRTKFKIKTVNIQQNDTLVVKYNFENQNKINVLIPNIKWRGNYSILVQTDTIFDYLGKGFSNFNFSVQLRTADEPRFGSLKGLLIAGLDTNLGQPMVMAIEGDKIYYCNVINNHFVLENIPEGEYVLIAFYDQNRNEKYDFGDLKPFSFSERIIKVYSKINIRKGWTVEEIRF